MDWFTAQAGVRLKHWTALNVETQQIYDWFEHKAQLNCVTAWSETLNAQTTGGVFQLRDFLPSPPPHSNEDGLSRQLCFKGSGEWICIYSHSAYSESAGFLYVHIYKTPQINAEHRCSFWVGKDAVVVYHGVCVLEFW